MKHPLARQYTFRTLVAFAMPNIVMMIFMSLYTIVDGIFVSRFVGTTALSAINMVYPIINIQLGLALMVGSGGCAIIAKKLGEGKKQEASADFTFLMLLTLAGGLVFALLGCFATRPICIALGASAAQLELCVTYGRILLLFSPFYFLQTGLQYFFIAAGKPGLGLVATAGAGVTNMVLDYLFVGVWGMGIAGAAYATVIGYCIPCVVGVAFFARRTTDRLHFTKPRFEWRVLLNTCTNGSSEMVTNLAGAIMTFLFNLFFMRFYGEDGVAAITIVLYFQFVFSAVYFGYSMGIAPIISFKYGAQETQQLKKIFRSSLLFLAITSVASYALSVGLMQPALSVFTKPDSNVFALTAEGFPIFATSFLLMGLSIFASSMFTAFSNGTVSAIISFARTFVFLVGAVVLLPMLFGPQGVWLAVPVAEALGVCVSVAFLVTMKKKYQY